jgi:hypothetical protein
MGDGAGSNRGPLPATAANGTISIDLDWDEAGGFANPSPTAEKWMVYLSVYNGWFPIMWP